MVYTRKNRRGGGLFNGLMKKAENTPKAPTMSNLKAKRNYNLKHSKSRVANVLSTPGQVRHTNKERIEAEYQKAVDKLRKLENPVETASTMKTIVDSIKDKLQSDEARLTGAITLTIPVGIAQVLIKGLLVFIAALVFIFWDIPSMGTIPLSAYILPNRSFNTTRSAFQAAKGVTGVNMND
jgi:hypothetical protein